MSAKRRLDQRAGTGEGDGPWRLRLVLLLVPVVLGGYVCRTQGAMIDLVSRHQDALEPARVSSASHEAKLRHVFARAWAADVEARCIRMPSFFKESVVGIRRAAGERFEVFVLEPSIEVWDVESNEAILRGEMRTVALPRGQGGGPEALEEANERQQREAAQGPRLEDIRVEEFAQPIDAEAARNVISALSLMLGTVDPARSPTLGFDGVSYEFAARGPNGKEVRGKTWSPPANTRRRRLMQLVDALAALAKADASVLPAHSEAISRAAKRIIGTFGVSK